MVLPLLPILSHGPSALPSPLPPRPLLRYYGLLPGIRLRVQQNQEPGLLIQACYRQTCDGRLPWPQRRRFHLLRPPGLRKPLDKVRMRELQTAEHLGLQLQRFSHRRKCSGMETSPPRILKQVNATTHG